MLALYDFFKFFTRGNIQGTSSSKICLLFVYVWSVFCVGTGFVVLTSSPPTPPIHTHTVLGICSSEQTTFPLWTAMLSLTAQWFVNRFMWSRSHGMTSSSSVPPSIPAFRQLFSPKWWTSTWRYFDFALAPTPTYCTVWVRRMSPRCD